MNFIAPLTLADVGSKPTVDNADTDFPEPDSPTKATVCPAGILKVGSGVLLRDDVTSSQAAMLTCLSNILRRLPEDWIATPIGEEAEAELLDWDAEKYRQALAARG